MRQAQIRMKSTLMLFIAVLCLGFSPCEASDGLQVRVWTDKSNFLAHEPIVVRFKVTNNWDRKHCINLIKMSEDFIIEDNQGRVYVSHLRGMNMGRDLLEPGGTRHSSVEVSGLYKVVNVGEYTCYCQSVGCPAVLNSPSVTSDTARFRVIQPQGREKEALDRLMEIATLERPDPEDSVFLEYQGLADRYPKSVYAPKALDAAAGVYFYSQNLEQRRRVIPVCMRLIEEYPDSYYFILAFTMLVHTYEILKDKEGAIKTIHKLIKKHPNTRISAEAERRLKQVEEWGFE